MRISLLMLFLTLFLGLILWVTLSGALLWIGAGILLVFIIISASYADTAILFFLGAREVRAGDDENFHTAAVQEAYKLAVLQPRLYFYNGALERAFVLQNKKTVSLILSKDLLEICSPDELSAICFELLIQVKKNLASKRTKVMFAIGLISWTFYAITGLLLRIVRIKEIAQAVNWFVHYMMNPWLDTLFKITMGEMYFRKLDHIMKEYPIENDLLKKVGSKLRRPYEIYSLPSRKMIELSSVNKSRHYQNILTLEFLPHEWDLIFDFKAERRA